jgi:hypothetical protein
MFRVDGPNVLLPNYPVSTVNGVQVQEKAPVSGTILKSFFSVTPYYTSGLLETLNNAVDWA